MKIIEQKLDVQVYSCVPENAFFLDIETTGLSARNSEIYLIGVIYIRDGELFIKQWFSEGMSDEMKIIISFMEFSKNYDTCIHYNGNTFDLPFIKQCIKNYHLEYDFMNTSLDLYAYAKKYKKLLGTQSLKQRDIEGKLSYVRQDIYSGEELIAIYKNYRSSPNEEDMNKVLLHNYDDLCAMLCVYRLSEIEQYFDSLSFDNCEITDETVVLTFASAQDFCIDNAKLDNGESSIMFEGGKIFAAIRPKNGLVKYYFEDYKNYYYLPFEDKAVHKKLSVYTDPKFRQKANRENCYQYVNPAILKDKEQAVKYLKMLFAFLSDTK